MDVKALTKQLAEEKRHSMRYATPRNESKFSKRLQRLATPKAGNRILLFFDEKCGHEIFVVLHGCHSHCFPLRSL